ncbi:MAG: serpin family protein [Mediterranea sp.]|jgi:serpin B|nr:serpin family protein [Mediterranea sp.]
MKAIYLLFIASCLAACDQSLNEDKEIATEVPTVDVEDTDSVTPQLPERTTTPLIPLELSPAEQAMAEGNNTFAFELFKEVNRVNKETNTFLSPLSASYALNMVSNGAAGKTLAEMQTVLSLAGHTQSEINDFYKKLTSYLSTADGQTILGIANSIWLSEGFPVLPAFVDVNKDSYSAEVHDVHFNEATLKAINQWVNDKTYGCIPKILDQLGGDSYLINALYFNGVWQNPFGSEPGDFINNDGSSVPVTMLKNTGTYSYYADNALQIVELPYGNGTYSMVLLLPKDDPTLEKTIASLTPDNWNQWMNGIKNGYYIHVELPTFELSYDKVLNQPLRTLGMAEAFSSTADFSKMSPVKPLYISMVLQKSYIKVDEYGTTAAAVTTIGMWGSSGQPTTLPEPIDFIANKPFLYAIKENSTQTILFLGNMEKL